MMELEILYFKIHTFQQILEMIQINPHLKIYQNTQLSIPESNSQKIKSPESYPE